MADYPIPVFHFQVEWGGTKIEFSEVSGMNIETQVIEYRHGFAPEHTMKMPGIQKNGNITMKRGLFKGDSEYYKWWSDVNLNTITRRDLIISLLDENHDPLVTWKVMQAWPTKVENPTLKADGNEVAIESIELVHEGITMEYS
jgi:phage tail-like protein